MLQINSNNEFVTKIVRKKKKITVKDGSGDFALTFAQHIYSYLNTILKYKVFYLVKLQNPNLTFLVNALRTHQSIG